MVWKQQYYFLRDKLKIRGMHWSKSFLPSRISDRLLDFFGLKKSYQRIERFGLEPIDIVRVNLADLFHQRTVKCEMIPVREAETLDFLDEYFSTKDGKLDYSIYHSMQYKLIHAHSQGALRNLANTDYWKWHVFLRNNGINADVRTDSWIEGKVEKMLSVFDSIRNSGYDYSRFGHYPWVVNDPLIHTRYGYNYLPGGREIIDGHHRVAAAACLGYKSVYALLVKDIASHTTFGLPLDQVVVPNRR